MQVKIYYHHTDCGGVVYYARYLEFLEEARTEFLAERGLLLKILAEEGVLFIVGRQEMDYRFPARYADILQIDTKLVNIGNAKLEFEHEIKNQDDELIGAAKAILVCVDKDFKPRRISEPIRNKLKTNI